MEQWKGKTAFITGASAGIGYDLSSRLCELGMNVVGCARNIEKIEVRSLLPTTVYTVAVINERLVLHCFVNQSGG